MSVVGRTGRSVIGWAAVTAAAVAVTLLAPLLAGEQATAQETDVEGEETARGDELYAVHCAQCHGASGGGGQVDGSDAVAPPLVGMDVARVDLVLRTGRMPPAEPDGTGRGRDWSDGEREALVAHLTAVFDLSGGLPEVVDGDAARGRELFATHCAACHGYTGAGGVAGGGAITPQVSGLEPRTIVEAVRVGPFQMPQFGEGAIDEDGGSDVAAYLTEVAEEEGTPLNFVELNPVIASAFVAALALVVLLSCMWLAGRVTMFPDPEPPPGHGPNWDADQDRRA